MGIKTTLQSTTFFFKKNSLPQASLEAELLLSFILKKPREYLLAHGEKKINPKLIHAYKKISSRRASGVPMAYLLGCKEFYGLEFAVNQHTLIPRSETELIVEEAISYARKKGKKLCFVDVGTGSGCIIIALAKNLKAAKLVATDISPEALKTAKENAVRHQLDKKITFLEGNLLKPLILKNFDFANHPLIILANLPYLSQKQTKSSSIKFEPKLALAAGSDGLKYYREMFKQVKQLILSKKPPENIVTICEINPSQAMPIKIIIKKYFPQVQIKIKKDLRGLNRLIIAKLYHLSC